MKKKCDYLNGRLSSVHSRFRQENSHHAGEVGKFKSVIGRLEKDLEVARETDATRYREFEAFKDDVVDGNVEVSEIVFSNLLDRLARNHPTMDLSSYTLERISGMLALEDVVSCFPTPSPFVAHFLEAFPIIT